MLRIFEKLVEEIRTYRAYKLTDQYDVLDIVADRVYLLLDTIECLGIKYYLDTPFKRAFVLEEISKEEWERGLELILHSNESDKEIYREEI